jgi:hypothetical protein
MTQACRERVETVVVELQEAQTDCEPDAFAFGREAGRGVPMVACLGTKLGQLTRRCQAVFDGFARREAAAAKACADEARRYCRDALPGKRGVVICRLFRGRDPSADCPAALGRWVPAAGSMRGAGWQKVFTVSASRAAGQTLGEDLPGGPRPPASSAPAAPVGRAAAARCRYPITGGVPCRSSASHCARERRPGAARPWATPCTRRWWRPSASRRSTASR